MAGLTDQVLYHSSLFFSKEPTDVVIFDESDSHVFGEPKAFQAIMNTNRCVCFTATPDDNDVQGAEKQLVTVLGLKCFSYGFEASLTLMPKIDGTVDKDVLKFMKNER